MIDIPNTTGTTLVSITILVLPLRRFLIQDIFFSFDQCLD